MSMLPFLCGEHSVIPVWGALLYSCVGNTSVVVTMVVGFEMARLGRPVTQQYVADAGGCDAQHRPNACAGGGDRAFCPVKSEANIRVWHAESEGMDRDDENGIREEREAAFKRKVGVGRLFGEVRSWGMGEGMIGENPLLRWMREALSQKRCWWRRMHGSVCSHPTL